MYAELDTGETLRVPEGIALDFALCVDKTLSAQEYGELCARCATALAKERALRVLGSRQMSREEMVSRLVSLGETEETAEDTAEWLADIGLIDDEVYASAIAESYTRRGWGERKIRDEFFRRRVPRQYWNAAIEAQRGADMESDAPALTMLERKLGGQLPDRDARRKISGQLVRRGFSWDEINDAFRAYLERIE
jgi:regulatory protein